MDDIELPPLASLQVPRVEADVSLADIRVLRKWAERVATEHARAAITADRAKREIPSAQPTQEPEYWQWRRKGQPWSLDRTFNSRVFATTDDSEVRPLYAAPAATQPEGQEAPDHIADVNKMVLDAARYRFLRDNEYASWRPYSLRAGYSATEADALVDAAMSAQAGGGK